MSNHHEHVPDPPRTMATILIPTDFSDNAMNAAIYALRLFGPDDHDYTVLNCYDRPIAGDSSMVDITERLAANSREAMEPFLATLKEAIANDAYRITTRSKQGQLHRVVGNYRHRASIPELVVMGTQGASGLKEVLMGSNTADVIKSSGLPVLTVPENGKFNGIKRILLADDGDDMDEKTLEVLIGIVERTNADLIVARVVNDTTVADPIGVSGSAFQIAMKDIPYTTVHLSNTDVEKALNDEIERSKADLAVVAHRKRGIFDRIFHRSTSAKLAMHTHIPLLVLQYESK